MKVHVTRAYLDMARSVIDTQVFGDPTNVENEDALFSLMSCTYVFSFMALTSFVSAELQKLWAPDGSALRLKFGEFDTFGELMAGPLKELKAALKELASELGIDPLHKARPESWRKLTELLKGQRDFFIHPNPEQFHDHVSVTGNQPWGFPSNVAAEIIEYFFIATDSKVPPWLAQSQIRCRGFDYVHR